MAEKQGREPNSMAHKKINNGFLATDRSAIKIGYCGFFLIMLPFFLEFFNDERYKKMNRTDEMPYK